MDIVHWFLHGSNGQTDLDRTEVQETSHNEASKTPASKARRHGIEFDLDKGANLRHFIEDMKSIEPISKQFSRAREELLEELKKLTPRKPPK